MGSKASLFTPVSEVYNKCCFFLAISASDDLDFLIVIWNWDCMSKSISQVPFIFHVVLTWRFFTCCFTFVQCMQFFCLSIWKGPWVMSRSGPNGDFSLIFYQISKWTKRFLTLVSVGWSVLNQTEAKGKRFWQSLKQSWVIHKSIWLINFPIPQGNWILLQTAHVINPALPWCIFSALTIDLFSTTV